MPREEDVERQLSPPQRSNVSIIWWALAGAYLGFFCLDSALTGGGRGPYGSSMDLSIGMILLGALLPTLFFDANGHAFSSAGLWSAARRHWSGVFGLLLMLSGVGLIVANLTLRPETVRPADWAFGVAFLLMPLMSIFGTPGPRVRFRLGAPVAIGVAAAVLIGGNLLYGSQLQWAYAQLNALFAAITVGLVALAFGVLRLMDWMIARSERRAD